MIIRKVILFKYFILFLTKILQRQIVIAYQLKDILNAVNKRNTNYEE